MRKRIGVEDCGINCIIVAFVYRGKKCVPHSWWVRSRGEGEGEGKGKYSCLRNGKDKIRKGTTLKPLRRGGGAWSAWEVKIFKKKEVFDRLVTELGDR